MPQFHRKQPVRSQDVPFHADHTNHKEQLSRDFNESCGYCDSPHEYFGGFPGAWVEHFVPRTPFEDKHAAVVQNYNNLIYSCPFCNRRKSNTWPMSSPHPSHDGTHGFVDPCDPAYADHLARSNAGYIVPRTPLGEYMALKIGLFQLRHHAIWLIEALISAKKDLRQAVKGNKDKLSIEDYGQIYETLESLDAKIDEIQKRVFRS